MLTFSYPQGSLSLTTFTFHCLKPQQGTARTECLEGTKGPAYKYHLGCFANGCTTFPAHRAMSETVYHIMLNLKNVDHIECRHCHGPGIFCPFLYLIFTFFNFNTHSNNSDITRHRSQILLYTNRLWTTCHCFRPSPKPHTDLHNTLNLDPNCPP